MSRNTFEGAEGALTLPAASYAVADIALFPSLSWTFSEKAPFSSALILPLELLFTKISIETPGSAAPMTTISGVLVTWGRVLKVGAEGGVVSRITTTEAGFASFPARSTAVTVRVLLPSDRLTAENVKWPFDTCAGVLFTFTTAVGSSMVPVTVIIFLLVTVPSFGDVMAIFGGVESTVTLTVAVPVFPAALTALAEIIFRPSMSLTSLAVNVPELISAGNEF